MCAKGKKDEMTKHEARKDMKRKRKEKVCVGERKDERGSQRKGPGKTKPNLIRTNVGGSGLA